MLCGLISRHFSSKVGCFVCNETRPVSTIRLFVNLKQDTQGEHRNPGPPFNRFWSIRWFNIGRWCALINFLLPKNFTSLFLFKSLALTACTHKNKIYRSFPVYKHECFFVFVSIVRNVQTAFYFSAFLLPRAVHIRFMKLNDSLLHLQPRLFLIFDALKCFSEFSA